MISFKDLQNENNILKRDVRNLDIESRKIKLDVARQQQSRLELESKVNDLASRYLSDQVKWISGSITSNNFVTCKQRLVTAIQKCRDIQGQRALMGGMGNIGKVAPG